MPTRWSAAWSACRTAPARRCASASSPAAPKAEEALAAGADVVGADDLAAAVQEGKIEFDRCIATPDMMGLVGRLGKILGPRGLMPNPRLGTVTMDVKGAVPRPRPARSSSAPRRPASCMPASARPPSSDEPAAGECPRLHRRDPEGAKPTGAKGTYMKKVARQLLDGPGREGGVLAAASAATAAWQAWPVSGIRRRPAGVARAGAWAASPCPKPVRDRVPSARRRP